MPARNRSLAYLALFAAVLSGGLAWTLSQWLFIGDPWNDLSPTVFWLLAFGPISLSVTTIIMLATSYHFFLLDLKGPVQPSSEPPDHGVKKLLN